MGERKGCRPPRGKLRLTGLSPWEGGARLKDRSAAKEVFAALKAILQRYEPGMAVQTDEPTYSSLNTGKPHPKKPVRFGAVRLGKSYVSYHLFPVHDCPPLLKGLSEHVARWCNQYGWIEIG